MSETLKELLDKRADIEQQLIAAYGEISPEMEAALTTVEFNTNTKVDSYGRLIDRLAQDAEWFEAKAEKYTMAVRQIKNLKEKLLENVKARMLEAGLTELAGEDEIFKLSSGKASVVIEPGAALPRKYIETTIVEKPIKDALKKALENGELLGGVSLKPTVVLRRSLNKRT